MIDTSDFKCKGCGAVGGLIFDGQAYVCGACMIGALSEARATIAKLEKRYAAADKMRDYALGALATIEIERNELRTALNKEDRISDSEMMSLLRIVNRDFEVTIANHEATITRHELTIKHLIDLAQTKQGCWDHAEAEVKAQAATIKGLREALENYGDHSAGCALGWSLENKCTCGFIELNAALEMRDAQRKLAQGDAPQPNPKLTKPISSVERLAKIVDLQRQLEEVLNLPSISDEYRDAPQKEEPR